MSEDTQSTQEKLKCINLVLKNLDERLLKNEVIDDDDTEEEDEEKEETSTVESAQHHLSKNENQLKRKKGGEKSVSPLTTTSDDLCTVSETMDEEVQTIAKKLLNSSGDSTTNSNESNLKIQENCPNLGGGEETASDFRMPNPPVVLSKRKGVLQKRKDLQEKTVVPNKQKKYDSAKNRATGGGGGGGTGAFSTRMRKCKSTRIPMIDKSMSEKESDYQSTAVDSNLHMKLKDIQSCEETDDDISDQISENPSTLSENVNTTTLNSKETDESMETSEGLKVPPERKSIIEIRISNEVNALLEETASPADQDCTNPPIENQITDMENHQGGIEDKELSSEEATTTTTSTAAIEGSNTVDDQMVRPSSEERIESDICMTVTTDNKPSIEEKCTEITIKTEEPSNISDGQENSSKDANSSSIQLTESEQAADQQYRSSCEPFLQNVPCFKLKTSTNVSSYDDEKVPRCRECRRKDMMTMDDGSGGNAGSDVYCRFYEFRRLQYTRDGELCVAGFPNPYKDPRKEDINIWEPDENTEPTAGYMDVQVCRYILLHVGDQFCYLWQQEVEALKMHENPDDKIAWKKLVRDIREICDVCDTTLFNYHWTCNKCGFGVCLDCFKDRKAKHVRLKFSTKSRRGRDEYFWLMCTNSQKHQIEELMLTQIITGDSLKALGQLLHEVRILWKIPQKCNCLLSRKVLPDDRVKEKIDEIVNDMINESRLNQQTASSSLATKETLRHQRRMEKFHKNKLDFARSLGIDYVPGRMITKETLDKDPITTAFDSYEHINFLRKGMAGFRRFLPPKVMTMCSSTLLAPNVRHEWLCDGKLLRLTDPMHPDNRILFQEVWKCGQPVMISEVARSLNLDLWRPEAFCRDFGDKPNDLINCLNGNLVPNQPMRHFWEGFQCIKKRLVDAHGKPMLLKLKDWPPGDDFAEILPTRYADLMKGLPLPEYTLRTGNLNIASCLPKMFVPPDLGPKMYNAYGSALHPDKGTTNLHLDISDAVNVMVYVGIPQDAESKSQLDAAQHAIAMGGCDFLTRLRCQSSKVMPGALWHIFAARDADKIRDLLNRVTLEKGFRLEPDHDPIHDQNWYLDDELRARLFLEYRVKGYPIVQCLGDAVFIPAGAPHQVQNLHNCIKVAEDFVSPENITHCYHLTHEFRQLSNSHTNHEDKLQIKNIIFHAVKDCCTILMRALNKRYESELSDLKRKRKSRKEEEGKT